MTIEIIELKISEELKRKIEIVCRFANVKYNIINENIKSIKNTNIVIVKTHIIKIKGMIILCMIFNEKFNNFNKNDWNILPIKVFQSLEE